LQHAVSVVFEMKDALNLNSFSRAILKYNNVLPWRSMVVLRF